MSGASTPLTGGGGLPVPQPPGGASSAYPNLGGAGGNPDPTQALSPNPFAPPAGGGTPGGQGTPRPQRPRLLHLPDGFVFPFAVRGEPGSEGLSPGATVPNVVVINNKKKMPMPVWIPPEPNKKAPESWKTYAKLYSLYVYSELRAGTERSELARELLLTSIGEAKQLLIAMPESIINSEGTPGTSVTPAQKGG